VLAQSWWLASELVRRHPEFILREAHPGDGMYDVLIVRPRSGEDFASTRAMLNRSGSVQVQLARYVEPNTEWIGTWSDVIAAADPHEFVKRIERVASWNPSAKTPATTERSIAFRVVSALMTTMVNDRSRWDVRNESLNEFISGADDAHFDRFADARRDLLATATYADWDDSRAHFWVVLRDDDAIGMISEEGRLYLPRARQDLLSVYRASGRNLSATIATALGSVL
jgi:hypothetical protein